MPFDAVWHSPLERASQTARAVAERMPSLSPQPSALLFDCVPTGMTGETPTVFEPFFGSVTEAEVEAGSAQMSDAISEYLVRKRGEVHELLITHNFVIGWFVREVLQAPRLAVDDAQPGALRAERHRAAAGPAVDAAVAQRHGAPAGRAAHRTARDLPRLRRRSALAEGLAVPARRVRIVVVRGISAKPELRVETAGGFERVVGVENELLRAELDARRSRSSSSSRPQPRPRVSGQGTGASPRTGGRSDHRRSSRMPPQPTGEPPSSSTTRKTPAGGSNSAGSGKVVV